MVTLLFKEGAGGPITLEISGSILLEVVGGPTVPQAPTIGTATRGNASASVTFTANGNGGSAITSFTVTSSPGGISASGASSPVNVPGLTNGTAYTFTVVANNVVGPSLPSASSNSVTPATVPGAPTIGTATPGNTQATVPFSAPASDGGSAITGYTATSSPAGGVDSNAGSTSLSHLMTGLTNGVSYTFTVTATNAVGTGSASGASNAVTPATVPAAPTIGTATAGNASASVPFTPNSNGGSVVTSFVATSSPGGFTGSSASSPISVNGLANGTAYTFTVTATNAIGTSAPSSPSNSVTPVASGDLTMYANGVLNALWPIGQDLSFHGTNYAPAWAAGTTYAIGNLVSVTGVTPSQVYRSLSNGNLNNALSNATFWLPVTYPDNYVDTTVVQGGQTYSLSLSGQFAGWQQATNWPRPDQGGTNGQDISAYTQIEFDYWQPSSNCFNGAQFHYNRSLGNDIGVSTQFSGTTLTNIVGALANGSWNTNLKVPLCFLGSLSSYNYYKHFFQSAASGQIPIYFNNVKFVAGAIAWIYRGGAGLESGWTDQNTNATITYNFAPNPAISSTFYSLNNPLEPMATFTGVMTAGGSLTVSSVVNTIKVGMSVVGGSVPANCVITGGSGTSWTVSPAANISAASMSAGFPQTNVNIVRWVPSASASAWRTNFAAGFNTTGYDNVTVALLPTAAGYAYTIRARSTSGTILGGSPNLATFTPADNGVSTSHWTVYSVPLSSIGAAATTIGAIEITDTSGHTNTIYACQFGFWK